MTPPALFPLASSVSVFALSRNKKGPDDICAGAPFLELDASTETQAFYTNMEEGYRQFLSGNINQAKGLLCAVRHFAPHFGWEVLKDRLLLATENSDPQLNAIANSIDDAVRAFEDVIADAESPDTMAAEYQGLNRLLITDDGEINHFPFAEEYRTLDIAALMADADAKTVLSYVNPDGKTPAQFNALQYLHLLADRGEFSFFAQLRQLLDTAELTADIPGRRAILTEADRLASALDILFPCSKTKSRLALVNNELAALAKKQKMEDLDEETLREASVELSYQALQLAGGLPNLDEEGWRIYGWARSEMAEYINDSKLTSDTLNHEDIYQRATQLITESIRTLTEAASRFPQYTKIKGHLAFAIYNRSKITAHHTDDKAKKYQIYLDGLQEIQPIRAAVLNDSHATDSDKGRVLRALAWSLNEALNMSEDFAPETREALIAEVSQLLKDLQKIEPTGRGKMDLAFAIAKSAYGAGKARDHDALSKAVAQYGQNILSPCESVESLETQSSDVDHLFDISRRALMMVRDSGGELPEYYRAMGLVFNADRLFKEGEASFRKALDSNSAIKPKWEEEVLDGMLDSKKMLSCGADDALTQADRCAYGMGVYLQAMKGADSTEPKVKSAHYVAAYVCDVGQTTVTDHYSYKEFWRLAAQLQHKVDPLKNQKTLEGLTSLDLAQRVFDIADILRQIRELPLEDQDTADVVSKKVVEDLSTYAWSAIQQMADKHALSRVLNEEFQGIQSSKATTLDSNTISMLEDYQKSCRRSLGIVDELERFTIITKTDPIPGDLRDLLIAIIDEADLKTKIIKGEREEAADRQVDAAIAAQKRFEAEASAAETNSPQHDEGAIRHGEGQQDDRAQDRHRVLRLFGQKPSNPK